MQLVLRRAEGSAACPIARQRGAHCPPLTVEGHRVHFGAGNTHLMSNPASSRSSAYQWDFCLEREVEHLQEWVQAALPPAAPLQLPPQG